MVYDDRKLEEAARHFLEEIDQGRFLDNEAARNTPRRMAQMFKQMCTAEEFSFTTFDAPSQDMITLAPISFYTMCEHHTAPFFGSAYISYVPDKKIAGLSKFPRLVKNAAKGFWTQEHLTNYIAEDIDAYLNPLGVGVVVQAEHLCMAMRGVEAPGVVTTTSTMRGVYADHSKTAKSEFMQMIANKLQ